MKVKLLVLAVLVSSLGWGQVILTNASPSNAIDFSASMQPTVGNGAFSGSGFQPTPAIGQLNSNAWAVTGWSDGALAFGAISNSGDYARGAVTAAQSTGGMYAFTAAPQSAANPCLMMQPGGLDFSPGTLTLRIRNDGTDYIVAMDISYNLFIRNDQPRSNTFNFSYSDNNTTYTNVSALDYTSTAIASLVAPVPWVQVGTSPSRSTTITDLAIAPGGYFYIRWSSADAGGSGSRDEFGLDDINMSATYGIPNPPVITSDLSDSTLQNAAYSYFITATNNPASYAATGLPAGLSINTATGEISGVPTIIGTFDIVITVTNPGGTATEILELVVFPPGPEINLRGATGGTNTIVSGSIVAIGFNNTLFAGQIIGNSQVKDFRIQNLGTANLILNGGVVPYVTISGFHPGDFTITQPASGTITPGNFIDFQITFSPLGAGIRTAVISIANNDSDENPYTFLVQGSGKAPLIDVYGNGVLVTNGLTNPLSTNFTFFEGVNVSSSKANTFYVTNNGGEDLVLSLPVTISGLNASDFIITTAPAGTISASNGSPLVITFTPSALGLRTATVSIVNNVIGESPYTFEISGIGIDYDLCSYGVTEILKTIDFEDVPITPAWGYIVTTTIGAVEPLISGGQAYGSSRTTPTNKFIGNKSFQVFGPFGSTSTSSPKVTVNFDAINTNELKEVELNFEVGAYSSNNTQGLDVGDIISVFVSVDNGITWSSELKIKGNVNSIWDINTLNVSNVYTNVYKGNNSPYEISSPSNSEDAGFREITITNLPAVSNLLIKFEIVVDRNDEIWVIDNVTISGKLPLRSEWNNGWTPNPPTSTTKAIFQTDYDTSLNGGSVTACACQIDASAAVIIKSGDYFQINTDLINNGTLTLENSASLVQKYDFSTNTGVVKMTRTTRNMYRWDYAYWGSPVEENIISQIPIEFDLKYKWVSGINSNWAVLDVVTPGQGFITRVKNIAPFDLLINPNRTISFEFTGKPNNGLVNATMTQVDTSEMNSDNYNLLANPYPSAIDANDFLTQNSSAIDGTVYYWTSVTPYPGSGNYSNGDYAKWNLTGGVGTNALNDNPTNITLKPSGQIVAGQGFFVRALVHNAAVTFRNSQRLTTPNTQFFRIAQQEESQDTTIDKHRFWLNLTSENGLFNQMLIGYVLGATNEKDWGYDGISLVNNPVNLYSYVEGTALSIQGRALPFEISDVVLLGLRITTAGVYTIALEELDGLFAGEQAIYIEDFVTGNIHNLKVMPYTFTSASGTFTTRFQIRYTNETLSSPEVTMANQLFVYVSDGINVQSQLELIEQVTVYDLLGKNLYEGKGIQMLTHKITQIQPSRQVLFVRVTLANGAVVTKKVVY